MSVSLILILAGALASGKTSGVSRAKISSRQFQKAAQTNTLKYKNLKNRPKYANFERAQTLSQAATNSMPAGKEEQLFSAMVNVSYSRSMVDRVNGTLSSSRTVMGSISTKLLYDWKLNTSVSYDEDLRDPESISDGFSDVSFGFSRKSADLSYWLRGSPSFSFVLPTSEYTTQVQNLKTSVGVGYTFTINPDYLAKGFGLGMSLGASRNFHAYDTDKQGRILNEYGVRESFFTDYGVQNWSFSFNFTMRHGMNYAGSWTQAYVHSEEVGYTLSKAWSISAGHTNSGSWLAPNGQDSNLKLINEDDSIIYVSTSVIF